MTFISQTLTPQSTPDMVLLNVPCDPSVNVGDWVRMDGTGTAIQAIADSLANSNVIGLVEFKPSITSCNIRVLGVSEPLFVGLDETKEYYLSNTTAGAMDLTVPVTSGHIVLKVGQPYDSQRLLVLKGTRMQRS